MPTRRLASVLVATCALFGGLTALTGCDTPQAVEPRALRSGEQLSDTLSRGSAQVDRVLETLDALRFGPADQRVQNYRAFSNAVSELGVTSDTARSEARRMRQLGDRYFENWTNVTLRETPEDRRATAPERRMADERFQSLLTQMTGLRRSFDTFESNVLEIEQMLPGRLTDQGLAAIDPIRSQLPLQAADVRNQIAQVNQLISNIVSARR